MRILFSFAGGAGHFEPLVPIARAAAAAGHAVAFTAHPERVPGVRARGFEAFPTGAAAAGPRRRLPLVRYDLAHEERVLRERFAGVLARERAAGVVALAAEWRPDVVVRDEADFGAAVAAERLGLPHANVLVIGTDAFVRPEVVAAPLAALRAEHGLPPETGDRELVLSPFPPSFRALPPGGRAIGPAPSVPADAPAWLERLDGLVYFTLGTVFPLESGDLFARVLAGLRELDSDVVVTIGRDLDPAELGLQPPHVRVERHVDHAVLLPRCRVVVSHAGAGTVLGALTHGLPSVLLPIGADQPLTAARCAELGVARVLDPLTATPADMNDAVAEVLREPSYRRAAEDIRDEIRALPGPEHAVELLTRPASR